MGAGTVRQVGGAMHRLLAFVALVLLIAYAPIGDAFAGTRTGHKNTSKARAVHSPQAMARRRGIRPWKLRTERKLTIHSKSATDLKGAKLGATGARRHRLRRLRTV